MISYCYQHIEYTSTHSFSESLEAECWLLSFFWDQLKGWQVLQKLLEVNLLLQLQLDLHQSCPHIIYHLPPLKNSTNSRCMSSHLTTNIWCHPEFGSARSIGGHDSPSCWYQTRTVWQHGSSSLSWLRRPYCTVRRILLFQALPHPGSSASYTKKWNKLWLAKTTLKLGYSYFLSTALRGHRFYGHNAREAVHLFSYLRRTSDGVEK